MKIIVTCLLTLAMTAADAAAQSLFRRDPVPVELAGPAGAGLQTMSLTYVPPPRPREFLLHDLVTIIIDETSQSTSEQTLETNKDYDIAGELVRFPSLRHLLELQLENGDTNGLAELALNFANDFSGEGTYERNDRMVARVSGKIIDVKPNGNLVIEARKTIANDGEQATIIVSGVCRGTDVTAENTILSQQMADLRVQVINEGDVRDAGTKGLIPRVMEAVFAF